MSAPADDGEWETQTTRKQRKKQAKETKVPVATASSSAASAGAAASSSSSSSSSSALPVASTEDDSSMESDFLASGLIGLDGQQIAPGTPLITPPPQAPLTKDVIQQRKARYNNFDESQLPKCFVCQTRHDFGECRKKDKL